MWHSSLAQGHLGAVVPAAEHSPASLQSSVCKPLEAPTPSGWCDIKLAVAESVGRARGHFQLRDSVQQAAAPGESGGIGESMEVKLVQDVP